MVKFPDFVCSSPGLKWFLRKDTWDGPGAPGGISSKAQGRSLCATRGARKDTRTATVCSQDVRYRNCCQANGAFPARGASRCRYPVPGSTRTTSPSCRVILKPFLLEPRPAPRDPSWTTPPAKTLVGRLHWMSAKGRSCYYYLFNNTGGSYGDVTNFNSVSIFYINLFKVLRIVLKCMVHD